MEDFWCINHIMQYPSCFILPTMYVPHERDFLFPSFFDLFFFNFTISFLLKQWNAMPFICSLEDGWLAFSTLTLGTSLLLEVRSILSPRDRQVLYTLSCASGVRKKKWTLVSRRPLLSFPFPVRVKPQRNVKQAFIFFGSETEKVNLSSFKKNWSGFGNPHQTGSRKRQNLSLQPLEMHGGSISLRIRNPKVW